MRTYYNKKLTKKELKILENKDFYKSAYPLLKIESLLDVKDFKLINLENFYTGGYTYIFVIYLHKDILSVRGMLVDLNFNKVNYKLSKMMKVFYKSYLDHFMKKSGIEFNEDDI